MCAAVNGRAARTHGQPAGDRAGLRAGAGAGAGTGTGTGTGQVNGHVDDDLDRQVKPPPLVLDDPIRAKKIESCMSGLVVGGATLRRVAAVFERELTRGLRQQPSSLQMENTYVPELPDGTEEGVFLALDLGGTNFRVLLLELRAGQLVREDVKQYHISDELRLGPGEDLFNFLADCVHDFVRAEGTEHEEMSLGFTFSFPMKQHSISSGELITWTKSFKCGGMAGVDVAALLQRCLRARGLRIAVRVLLNDTTGTLVAGAQRDPRVGIGVIMGTGSNGCYMERAERVSHWEARRGRAVDVCVDVEWGAFGDNGCLDFIKTDFDREVDARSLLVGSFTFEKYIGGKYLGDLLRAVLARVANAGLLPAAPPPGSLTSAHISLFEEENECGETARTVAALEAACSVDARDARDAGDARDARDAGDAGRVRWTPADALVAQHAARLISTRAAQLVAVCISVLVARMGREHVVVAVDGSVFKRHPRIAALVDRHVRLLQPEHSFSIVGAEDGSGKGSALTAAIAARLARDE